MNETFEASNGVTVMRNPDDGPDIDYQSWSIGNAREVLLAPHEIDALREFFQHERDQELGRWRDPENLHRVAYATSPHTVLIMDESTGCGTEYSRQTANDSSDNYGDRLKRQSARAYFAAHPEPKHIPTEPGSVLQGTGPNRTILHRGYPVHGRESDRPWTALGGATYADEDVHGFFHGQFVQLIPKEES